MFAGIIEEIGIISDIKEGVRSSKIVVSADKILSDLKEGDSLAIDGACMTVSMLNGKKISVDASSETLKITTLGDLRKGNKVNLERAIRFSDRIGGHLVSGHVDGIGSIADRKRDGDSILLKINAPPNILRYSIRKGSIAVDGISLTINEVGSRFLLLMLIPFTIKMTTIGSKRAGDRVNLENDLIGKYVETLLRQDNIRHKKNIDIDFIKEHGFI